MVFRTLACAALLTLTNASPQVVHSSDLSHSSASLSSNHATAHPSHHTLPQRPGSGKPSVKPKVSGVSKVSGIPSAAGSPKPLGTPKPTLKGGSPLKKSTTTSSKAQPTSAPKIFVSTDTIGGHVYNCTSSKLMPSQNPPTTMCAGKLTVASTISSIVAKVSSEAASARSYMSNAGSMLTSAASSQTSMISSEASSLTSRIAADASSSSAAAATASAIAKKPPVSGICGNNRIGVGTVQTCLMEGSMSPDPARRRKRSDEHEGATSCTATTGTLFGEKCKQLSTVQMFQDDGYCGDKWMDGTQVDCESNGYAVTSVLYQGYKYGNCKEEYHDCSAGANQFISTAYCCDWMGL